MIKRATVCLCLVAFVAPLPACQSGGVDDAEMTSAAQDGLSPIENYKHQVVADAMHGLRYDTGLVEIDRDSPRAVSGVGDAAALRRFDEGETLLFDQNQVIPAISAYTEAVLMAPNEAVIYVGLGRALAYKGLNAEAEAAFRTAIALNPELAQAHFELGNVLYGTGRIADAMEEWRIVIELNPSHGEAHVQLAVNYYYQGAEGAAKAHLDAAASVGAEIPSVLRGL